MDGQSATDPPRLLRKKEAAAYCGVSTPTFDKWVAAGSLPAALPGIGRWDRNGIDAAINRLSGIGAGAAASPAARRIAPGIWMCPPWTGARMCGVKSA